MSVSRTRKLLIDVARHLFAQKGLAATTMNDIAVVSQKGRRTLYTYFKNKEEIYYAVIQSEIERVSERMEDVANKNIECEQKIILLIYTHLDSIKEAVIRNGNLRAEFFRNIWMVEKVRKAFDYEELELFKRVLREGCDRGQFNVQNPELVAEIFHYSIKGLEVPYIYGRMGNGMTVDTSRPIVTTMVRRVLGIKN
ncbi:MAG: TetR/AcrR family transcriptional regulator [Prevotellaceae bacterium]|nr:TetR/AcrR family transcriptional regulator [Candidatus Faecinaster equi]